MDNVVYLSMGSNSGDRVRFFNLALRLLNDSEVINSVETSFLYTTTPWGNRDQPMYLNTAIKLQTLLSPFALLKYLKKIEVELGRDLQAKRWTERVIDLDIIFYDDLIMDSPELIVPHVACHEREFVLKPLIDAWPTLVHPKLNKSIIDLYMNLSTYDDNLHRVIACEGTHMMLGFDTTFRSELPLPLLPAQFTTSMLVGILNLSDDSFSDGGCYDSVEKAIQQAVFMIKHEHVAVIDIGIQSTKPGTIYYPFMASDLSDIEKSRLSLLTSVITRLRMQGVRTMISIDTMSSFVARIAVDAGANIVNDVSGGSFDVNMIDYVAKNNLPFIISYSNITTDQFNNTIQHKKSDKTMLSVQNYIEIAQIHILKLIQLALEGGIQRYNIILDLGLGFSKNPLENLILVKNVNTIMQEELFGYPTMIGPSRKKHLETLAQIPQLMTENCISPAYKNHYLDYVTGIYLSEAIKSNITFFRTHNVHELSAVYNFSHAFANNKFINDT